MKFGMTEEQYQLLNQLVIVPLKNRGFRVYIFGSRVGKKFHSHSDVDLLFKSDSEISLPSGFLSKIKENIENSRFPFLVDLVEEKYLASSYRNSVLKAMVEL